MPTVALGANCQSPQVGSLRDRAPGTFDARSPKAVHGEVEKVVSIGREVAAPFVDATIEPLADLEIICLTIPSDDRRVSRWAATNNDRRGGLARKQNVEPGSYRSRHLVNLSGNKQDFSSLFT